MQVTVLGAGIIGVSTAWHLLQRGHTVTLVDRQPDAALETSFGNAAQISVSYCEPWANREAPLKALKWMFSATSPLLFRPQLDPAQWLWGLKFLGQCNDAAFVRNVAQLVALGSYSHAALKDVVAATGIEFHRLERGIAHYYTDEKSFAGAAQAASVMQQFGVKRRVVSREELLAIEPALRSFGERIVGGTYTESDESGDARVFTQALARRCGERGAQLLWGHDIEQIEQRGDEITGVRVRNRIDGQLRMLTGDAFVVACGSYTTPLLRAIGIPVPGCDVVLVDDDGKPVPTGTPGEVMVRGPQVMSGYWHRPEETAKTLQKGWLFTGDVAVMDADGFLRIVDRKKDLVLVSGFNVYPNEVEDALAKMEAVLEAAVVPIPDAKTGEAVRAYIVKNPDYEGDLATEDILRHCKALLTDYKVPKSIIIRDELPKSPIGKILRKDLKAEVRAEFGL